MDKLIVKSILKEAFLGVAVEVLNEMRSPDAKRKYVRRGTRTSKKKSKVT